MNMNKEVSNKEGNKEVVFKSKNEMQKSVMCVLFCKI